MMHTQHIQDELIPTSSLMFRLILDRNALWLQFAPATIAVLWAAWYFWSRREKWDWMSDFPLLLLVSVTVAPYAWFTDETVALPAIMVGLYSLARRKQSLLPFEIIAGIAFFEVIAGIKVNSGFYVWTAPAWLLWYVLSVRPQPTNAYATCPEPLADTAI
jgi:hypothetical protein